MPGWDKNEKAEMYYLIFETQWYTKIVEHISWIMDELVKSCKRVDLSYIMISGIGLLHNFENTTSLLILSFLQNMMAITEVTSLLIISFSFLPILHSGKFAAQYKLYILWRHYYIKICIRYYFMSVRSSSPIWVSKFQSYLCSRNTANLFISICEQHRQIPNFS